MTRSPADPVRTSLRRSYALASSAREVYQRWIRKSASRKIFGTAALVAGLTFGCKAIALVRELFVANYFGAGDELDAYVIALLIPAVLSTIIGGSFNGAFMPTYVRLRAEKGEAEGERLYAAMLSLSVALLSVATLVLGLALPYLLPILASGFPPEKLELTRNLTYLMLPAVALNGVATLWSALLNTKDSFALPALSPGVVPLVTAIALVFGATRAGVYAMSVGFVLGMVAQLIVLAIGLRKMGIRAIPRLWGIPPEIRHVMGQLFPLIAGASLMTLSPLIDQSFAATLNSGSVSVLSYGNKVVALFLNITGSAVGTAILPYFSQQIAAGKLKEMRSAYQSYAVKLFLFSCLLTAPLVILAPWIVRLLFQRGSFTVADTIAVTAVMRLYAVQIPFCSMNVIALRLMAASRKNHILMIGSFLNFVTNILFDLLFMRWLGLPGIALATSFVYIVSSVYLSFNVWNLGRRAAEPRVSG